MYDNDNDNDNNYIIIIIIIMIKYSLSPLNVCTYALEIKIIEGLENKQYYNTLYILRI